VQQIRYYLRAPTNAAVSLNPGRDLIRATRRNLLAQTEEPAVEERLLSGVDRLEFLFYSGTEWRESWDSTEQTNTLPRAVKVRLRMAHAGVPDGLENPLELVVPLAPQTGTNQSASTGGPA
jgi:hypothetical protein